jgi:hypothetical protein
LLTDFGKGPGGLACAYRQGFLVPYIFLHESIIITK